MNHEIKLPFESFEKYALSLQIIAKQRELLSFGGKETDESKQLKIGIEIMIEKLITESEGIEKMILKVKQ